MAVITKKTGKRERRRKASIETVEYAGISRKTDAKMSQRYRLTPKERVASKRPKKKGIPKGGSKIPPRPIDRR